MCRGAGTGTGTGGIPNLLTSDGTNPHGQDIPTAKQEHPDASSKENDAKLRRRWPSVTKQSFPLDPQCEVSPSSAPVEAGDALAQTPPTSPLPGKGDSPTSTVTQRPRPVCVAVAAPLSKHQRQSLEGTRRALPPTANGTQKHQGFAAAGGKQTTQHSRSCCCIPDGLPAAATHLHDRRHACTRRHRRRARVASYRRRSAHSLAGPTSATA